MKKALIIALVFFLFTQFSRAQDFTYGAVTQAEMDMVKYPKDTSAHAVVLNEFGSSKISTKSNNIRLIYTCHVKIKIFDDKGFGNGTVQIRVYDNSDNYFLKPIYDIKGITSYKDEKGITRQTELQDENIYQTRENKNWVTYKFALPGLRNGCIIEYQFTTESPFAGNFPSWQFQSGIPKISSAYNVHIPGIWNYKASLRGPLKLSKNSATIESPCFSFRGTTCDGSFLVYEMQDIPAFVEEEAMTAAKNYKSVINFDLVDYIDLGTGTKMKYAKEWADVDKTLKNEPYFGDQLKRKGLLKEKIKTIIADKTDTLNEAKAIYSYLQKWFKWNEINGIYSENLSKALDKHSGSDADINLS